jgi:PhzF family phenazine biosynthesis protein
MVARQFQQVDVFASGPLLGNPVAVVVDGEGLSVDEMQAFARWTNLSETTFLSPPTDAGADYAVRIFTPEEELPFAGHPTLGSCHAWLAAGGTPADPATVVQQCAVGLVSLRHTATSLAFAAPPLIKSGPVAPAELERLAEILRIDTGNIVRAQWVDNGPGWIAAQLADADAVLAIEPGPLDGWKVGVIGAHPGGSPAAFEVRAFFTKSGQVAEDPVTGSLNASLAQWFLADGLATAPYTVRQGTALRRRGIVEIERFDPTGDVWIGGATLTLIDGVVDI